jgi:hypothetical protein
MDEINNNNNNTGHFNCRARAPNIHWIGGWECSRASMDRIDHVLPLWSRKEKSLVPPGNRNPTVQAVAMPTELSRLLRISRNLDRCQAVRQVLCAALCENNFQFQITSAK